MNWLVLRLKSFGYAFQGLYTLLQEQPNARLHALATVLVLILAYWLQISRGDWKDLVLVITLVWLAEGMNTALEYVCDALVPQQHPLIGKAKDVAAGAVLICASAALLMALLIFQPYVCS